MAFMKKKFLLCVFVLFFELPHSFAASGPAQKLERGAINIVSAPLEIPKEARIYWKEGAKQTPHILVWIFCGTVKGIINTIGREASGAWDVLSFPFAVPADYAPFMTPEYVF